MNEGTYLIYHVQHEDPLSGLWVNSALGHFLFDGMSFADRAGPRADVYRALIAPQNTCWRLSGVDGFFGRRDAEAAMRAVKSEHPRRVFRLVRTTYSKETVPVEEET